MVEVKIDKKRCDVLSTPNALCPACAKGRLHTNQDVADYHPYARHGYSPETKWTIETLNPKYQATGEL